MSSAMTLIKYLIDTRKVAPSLSEDPNGLHLVRESLECLRLEQRPIKVCSNSLGVINIFEESK
jgi:hypothetical protein